MLASGEGTLLQALLLAGKGLQVVAVGADRAAPALQRAAAAQVPGFLVALASYPDRPSWDAALTAEAARHSPDFVVCAGFMRLLGPTFLSRFAPRVVNSHPALLPAFPGAHAVRDALAYGVKITGATVHLVDAGLDTGPIVAQECVPVRGDDDEARLHERIKIVERRLLVDSLHRLAGGFEVSGGSVLLS